MRRPRAGTRPRPVLGLAALLAAGLAGCADVPVAAPDGQVEATVAAPVVVPGQAQQVRSEVAARLQEARTAADPALVGAAATGPAEALERLRVGQDGPQPGSVALDVTPATVLLAPQLPGWPRWFATVTSPDPAMAPDATAQAEVVAPSAGAEPSAEPQAGSSPGAVAEEVELPVIEVYDAADVRGPYRLWARLTMLPGETLPAFPAATTGVVSLGDGAVTDDGPTVEEPEQDEEASPDEEASEDEDLSEEEELRLALVDLATRYASVLGDGDASPAAAEFSPDAFVEAVRARTEAERAAVAGVATTTVTHQAFGDGEVLYAAQGSDGDVLAVTAVETTTTMTVRPGAGVLRPGAEVAAVAGVRTTDGTLTTRSVAALGFVVPAERGAIRLVAVGEGLVAAEAS